MRRLLIIGIAALGSIGILASPASAVTQSLAASSGTNTGSTTTVYADVLVGSDVIIGGNFTSVVSTNGVSHSAGGLAALNASTGAWVWSASPGGTTYALGTDGTNIFAGGTYGVRRYSQAGVKSSFSQPYGVGTVHGIAANSSDVYYGGGGGVAAATTAGAGVWHLSATDVRSVALNGSQLLVGGGFCTIGGATRPTIASLSTSSGSVDTSFNAKRFTCTDGAGQPALSIAVSGDTAYLGGGGTLNRVLAVNATTGSLTWQATGGDGDVQAVAIQGGDVYIGGHFDCLDGSDNQPCKAVRYKAAEYSTSGVLNSSWTPTFSGGALGVWALAGNSTRLFVGGVFTHINGSTRDKFAIFTS